MDEIVAAHEQLQEPGPEEQWSDSFYFGGGDPRSGAAFYTRIGRRPNEGRIEAALGVWLPDGAFVLCFAREDDGAALRAGGISYDCALPHELWRLSFDTGGLRFPRAELLADGRSAGEPVPVRGVLRFAAWVEPFAFSTGLTSRVAARHYEQPGSLGGVLVVGEQRVPIAGAGMRDHSWGVRDWQGVPYWKWTGMLVDPDTFLMLNVVGTEDGGETAGGCLMLDGTLAALAAATVEGDQRGYVARGRDTLGRTAELHGAATSVAPLRQKRDGRLTSVNEGLTRLRWDEHEGIGISEWLVQARR